MRRNSERLKDLRRIITLTKSLTTFAKNQSLVNSGKMLKRPVKSLSQAWPKKRRKRKKSTMLSKKLSKTQCQRRLRLVKIPKRRKKIIKRRAPLTLRKKKILQNKMKRKTINQRKPMTMTKTTMRN